MLVAQKLGREHRNVVAAIRGLLNTAKNSAVLGMFAEGFYYTEKNVRQPIYYMDRDGFSLLVMGFTGKDALKFKVDSMDAVSRIEAKRKGLLL